MLALVVAATGGGVASAQDLAVREPIERITLAVPAHAVDDMATLRQAVAAALVRAGGPDCPITLALRTHPDRPDALEAFAWCAGETRR